MNSKDITKQKKCKHCDGFFILKKGHTNTIYCSHSCWSKSRVKKIFEKVCENCENIYTPKDSYSAKKQRFCGNSCARKHEAMLRKEKGLPGIFTGFRHSDISKEKIRLNSKSYLRKKEILYRKCLHCDNDYQFSHNGSKPERKFCSKSCSAKSKGGGEKHYNWKGGFIRDRVLDLLGRECVKCGYCENVHALQIDHINGGGNVDRLDAGSSYKVYQRVLDNPEKYQTLCANCNIIKKIENKEHGNYYSKNKTTILDEKK